MQQWAENLTSKVISEMYELVCSQIAHILWLSPWHLHVFFAVVPSGLWLAPVCSGGSLSRSQNTELCSMSKHCLPLHHSLFSSRSHAPTAPLEWLPCFFNRTINLKNHRKEFLLALLKSVGTATSLQSPLLTVSLSPSGAVSGSPDPYRILIPGRQSINPTYFIPSVFRGIIICTRMTIYLFLLILYLTWKIPLRYYYLFFHRVKTAAHKVSQRKRNNNTTNTKI